MAQFSFIEVSYDASITSDLDMELQMERLGFIHRSQHALDQVGFWTHRQCIILLRRSQTGDIPKVSGLGFLGEHADIDRLGASFDRDSDFFVSEQYGLKTYIVQENQFQTAIDHMYNEIDMTSTSNNALKNFSGIVLDADEAIKDHFIGLGFRSTKHSANYDTLVGDVNNFSILISKKPKKSLVPTIICDTDDVFSSTAFFTAQGCDIPKFDDTTMQELNFGKLNHKIVGYNCKAFGSENSYTIENFIRNAANDIDLIVRQRSKYIHILEETVDSYYEFSTD